MALIDKNIVITPNIGQSADPQIVFSGADASTAAQNITLKAYPTNSGTLSFEGSAGQLFSITNSLSGTIFSVNDVSGIPSIEVLDTGVIKLGQYSGNILLGKATDNSTDKLQVNGSITSTVLTSSIATGTAPLTVTSTTMVSNLNVDLLDGQHGAYYNCAANLTGTLASAVTSSSLTAVGTITTGTWCSAIGVVNGTNITNLNAANLTGTLASGVTSSSLTAVGTITTGTWAGAITTTSHTTLTQVGTITTGTWCSAIGVVNGNSITNLNAANLTGTLASGVTSSSLTAVGTITTGTWCSAIGVVNGTNITNLNAANLTGTLASGVTSSSLTAVGTITTGTWAGSLGAINGNSITNLNAANLTGTLASGVTSSSLTAVGTITTGTWCSKIGTNCNYCSVGIGGLNPNSTATNNIAIGYCTLTVNTTGLNNIAIGGYALCANTSGTYNIAIGVNSLQTNTTGCNNTAVGQGALLANTIGTTNTAIGSNSMFSNTVGVSNTAQGYKSLYTNITGSNNTAIGVQSLYSNITSNSTAIGVQALYNTSTGSSHVAVGYLSLFCNTSGCANVAMGNCALYYNLTGCYNTAQGYKALYCNTGSCNSAVGTASLICNSSGNSNIANGMYSLFCNTSGSCNIAIGGCSLYNSNATGNNIAVGYCSGAALTTGIATVIGNLPAGAACICSVIIGAGTCERLRVENGGLYINGTAYSAPINLNTYCSLGIGGLNSASTGLNNYAIGYCSLIANTTGNNNFAVGCSTLDANTTGNNNIAIGFNSLGSNITGSNSVAIGYCSLSNSNATGNNIAVGYCSGAALTTGIATVIGNLPAGAACICSVIIGAGTCERLRVENAGLYINGSVFSGGLTTTDDNATNATYYPVFVTTAGGSTAKTASTELTFNPSSGTLSAVLFQSLSDRNKKINIIGISDAINTVKKLNGVEFDWKDNGFHSSGVIAQEIEQILPHLVQETDGIKSVNYSGLIGYLIEAIKELSDKIDNLENK